MSTQTPHTSQTLDRGLQILQLLAEASKDMTMAEIAAALDVHRTIAHRLVATLVGRGFLMRSTGNGYRLGTSLIRLAGSIGAELRAIARPTLKTLSEDTGETVHLVVLAGSDVMFVDAYESSAALRVVSRVGRSLPAHATSVGKALLSLKSPEELAALIPSGQLEKAGPKSIGTRAELLKELDAVRAQGYAVSQEESEVGVGSVGVAIVDRYGQPHAALSIAAPISRLTKENMARMPEMAMAAARKIGDHL